MFRYIRKPVMVLTLVVACLLVFPIAVSPKQQVKCPIDNSDAYFTGKTTTAENGKLLKLYKCLLYGHEFWVVAE